GKTGSLGETVAAADDEALEGESRIELAFHGGCRSRGGGWRGGCGQGETGAVAGRFIDRKRLARRETHIRALAENLGEALAQELEVVLVDPVHEKWVGNFQFDGLGADLLRHDWLEPSFECLRTAEPASHRLEDLLPEKARLLRLR